MSLKGKKTIFDGISNQFDLDPASIRLLSDVVLLKDMGDPDREGLVIIPEAFRERGVNQFGTYRIGLVIAVGEGDRYSEHGVTDEGQVRRRLLTAPCELCGAGGTMIEVWPNAGAPTICPKCEGTGRHGVCVPPQCKPGDRVLFEKRAEAQVYLNGERYVMCHAEQACIAVLEEE